MKFNGTQLVFILAILMAAIVSAHMFAPGAVSTIVAMATTLFAALFVQRHDGEIPPDGKGKSDKPDGAQ